MAGGRPSSKVRLGEVVGCLSLVTDLATGLPLEHGLRRAVLAVWLGEDLGLDDDELNTAYYVAQLGTVGCTLEMASLAPLVKDEIAVGVELVRLDPTRLREAGGFFLRHAGAGEPLWRRLGMLATVARAGPAPFQVVCRDVAMRVGDMIDIGPAVRQALGQCHERWDGKGGPQHLEGEEVDVAARIFHVVHDADIFNRIGGVDAVLAIMQQRSGRQYDPRIAARFRELGPEWLRGLDAAATWDGGGDIGQRQLQLAVQLGLIRRPRRVDHSNVGYLAHDGPLPKVVCPGRPARCHSGSSQAGDRHITSTAGGTTSAPEPHARRPRSAATLRVR